MKVTKELLAAYAEGNVSGEERKAVRQYLIENPTELESVMIMMDEDYELEPKWSEDKVRVVQKAVPFSDIAVSAAAFAPEPVACVLTQSAMLNNMMCEKRKDTFDNRLDDLLREIDD